MKEELPTTKCSKKLPDILSPVDIQNIINSTINLKHKTLFIVIYGAGLRVSEAVKLRVRDIDSTRMTLHIRNGKNKKDRFVILSPLVCESLRKYWKTCQLKDFIFPGKKRGHPMSTRTALEVYVNAKRQAGIHKDGGIHALRHAFATHMLEAGESIFVIKKLLGHSCIQTTTRYLSFIPDKNTTIKSPIDQLDI